MADRLTPALDAGELPTAALDHADDLAQELGGHPLALAQAAALILADALTITGYRTLLTDQKVEQALPESAQADGYTGTVHATWTIAADRAHTQTGGAGWELPVEPAGGFGGAESADEIVEGGEVGAMKAACSPTSIRSTLCCRTPATRSPVSPPAWTWPRSGIATGWRSPYLRPAVLVVDEVGYLPLDRAEANMIFQLVSRRYERGSMIITSNEAFREWGQLLGDDVLATAILDRLLHQL